MVDKSAADIAADMVSTFGAEAVAVAEARIRESAREGKSCGVEFWSEVSTAVQALTHERQSA